MRHSIVRTAPWAMRYAGQVANEAFAPSTLFNCSNDCRRMRLPSWLWQVAHEKSCGPPRKLKNFAPDANAARSAGAEVVGQWMRRLEQLLADATSTDDLQARILAAFDELPEAELVDVMGLGLAAARLAGMDAARSEAEAG